MNAKRVIFLLLVIFLSGALLVQGATDKELFNQGKAAYKSKRYSSAHDYFKRAVALNPTKAKYHYNLGLAARKLKSYREAYEAFSKAKQLDPQMKFTKKHQDFLNKLEEMRRHVPMESGPGRTDDEGSYAKGKAAYKNKQYQAAYNYFKQAARANPTKANRFYNLGLAARKIRYYREAYGAFTMAQQLDLQLSFTKKKQDFRNKLAEMQKKSSQKPAAKKKQGDSLSDFVYHKAVFEKGKELYRQGRYRGAYDKFKEAVGINRLEAKYQYNLGLAAYKLGKYLEVYDAFLSAEILDPDLKFTTKKSEFRRKMDKAVKFRREHGEEAQKKKDLWTPGAGTQHYKRTGSIFTSRNILIMTGGLVILIIIINVVRNRSRSRGEDVMARVFRSKAAGSDYRTGGSTYDDRYRYKDKWWKRKKYKKKKKRKLWRVRRKGDRSYIDHDYRDRDIYDDDRDSYNRFAAGSFVQNSLNRDDHETESGYYDAS